MCGIYGAIGPSDAQEKVFAGLKRLEYRGYDSWGVAALDRKEIIVTKQVGMVSAGEKLSLPAVHVALGHTRWATHGGVTNVNAHPHISRDGSFAVVHNGVIENFQELKDDLLLSGYCFVSETDTEVMVGLLEQERAKRRTLSQEVVSSVFQKLTGRNTLAVLSNSGEIFAIRNGSPLVVGKSEQSKWFLSSDLSSLSADATHFFTLDNGEGVHITQDSLSVFSVVTGESLSYELQKINVKAVSMNKGKYEHFMLKEIHEQSSVLINVVEQPVRDLSALVTALHKARKVFLIGAGSASFAAGEMAYLLRNSGIDATLVPSYGAASYVSVVNTQDVSIVFSQSGETADTNEAVEWFQQRGAMIASIVNMPGSTLTALSDISFMLQVGAEIAVGSTKALTGHFCWGWCISKLIAETKPSFTEEELIFVHNRIKQEVVLYQDQLARWFESIHLKNVVIRLQSQQRMFVLGRGQLFYCALEFALKMKEISYIHAEGFNAGELKHGVIALIEKGTPVVCLVADDDEKHNMLSAAQEVRSRGAFVIGISAQNNHVFDTWIEIPQNKDLVMLSSIIPAQLLTYFLSLEFGHNPDKPRNLAKSVTVK